jgi:tetratricopeptide (TPR) repeat protein
MRLMRALLLALACALPALPAAARDQGEVLLLRAENLAAEGRCADALPVLEQAKAAAPRDARVPLLAGRCLVDAGRYSEALAELDRARGLDPDLANVELYRGVALYHLGDMGASWTAIQAAEGRTDREALRQLYLGLLLLERQQTRDAALALERARSADPRAVEPVASFYSVLAWKSLDEQRRAEEALARVQALDPGGPWAKEAERVLAGIEQRPARRWWARATVGGEYDTNVGLFGTGAVLPTDISGRADARAVVSAEAGAELFRTQNWAAGVLGSWQSRLHDDLNEFDTHYPAAGVFLDRRLGDDTVLRARWDTTYGWVDWEPLVYTNAGRLQLFQSWGRLGDTEASIAGYHNDFFINDTVTPGPPVDLHDVRNRDGNGLRVGVEHTLPLGFWEASLRAGYWYNRYWSRGTEWDFQAHEVELGGAVKLPLELVLDGSALFAHIPYDHPSTYPNPLSSIATTPTFNTADRLDNQWRLSAGLSRSIGHYVTVSGRYTYVDNHSNVDAFRYTQQVVGGYVTVRFP